MKHEFQSLNPSRRIQSLGVGIGALLLLTTSGAMASTSLPMSTRVDLLGAAAKDQPLSPSSLAGIRGKYVNGARVVYFGLAMYSSWQDQLWVSSKISLHYDVSTKVWSFDLSSLSDGSEGGNWGGNPAYPTSVFPFNNSQGVKQDIQVAGDSNQVTNIVNVQLGPYPGGIGAFSCIGAPSPSTCTGPGTVSSTTGDSKPFSANWVNGSAEGGLVFGSNGVVDLGITTPNGSIGQELGFGGINQYANTKSNASTILNTLTMQIGTDGTVSSMYAQHLNLLMQDLAALRP